MHKLISRASVSAETPKNWIRKCSLSRASRSSFSTTTSTSSPAADAVKPQPVNGEDSEGKEQQAIAQEAKSPKPAVKDQRVTQFLKPATKRHNIGARFSVDRPRKEGKATGKKLQRKSPAGTAKVDANARCTEPDFLPDAISALAAFDMVAALVRSGLFVPIAAFLRPLELYRLFELGWLRIPDLAWADARAQWAVGRVAFYDNSSSPSDGECEGETPDDELDLDNEMLKPTPAERETNRRACLAHWARITGRTDLGGSPFAENEKKIVWVDGEDGEEVASAPVKLAPGLYEWCFEAAPAPSSPAPAEGAGKRSSMWKRASVLDPRVMFKRGMSLGVTMSFPLE